MSRQEQSRPLGRQGLYFCVDELSHAARSRSSNAGRQRCEGTGLCAKQAPILGGDPARLVVMGHSSGAHLVALLAADSSISAHQGVAPWIATVALDSAAMDVETIMRRRHFRFYDQAFKQDPEYWRQASPIHRLTGKPVTALLIVCSSRRADSCPQGRALAAKASGFGGRADVLPVALTHPEVNDLLGTQSTYTDGVDGFLKSLGLQ